MHGVGGGGGRGWGPEPPGSSTGISSLMRMGPLLLISHLDLLEVKYHSALEDP